MNTRKEHPRGATRYLYTALTRNRHEVRVVGHEAQGYVQVNFRNSGTVLSVSHKLLSREP